MLSIQDSANNTSKTLSAQIHALPNTRWTETEKKQLSLENKLQRSAATSQRKTLQLQLTELERQFNENLKKIRDAPKPIPNNTTMGAPVAEPVIKQTVSQLIPQLDAPAIIGEAKKFPLLPLAAGVGALILLFVVVKKNRNAKN